MDDSARPRCTATNVLYSLDDLHAVCLIAITPCVCVCACVCACTFVRGRYLYQEAWQ